MKPPSCVRDIQVFLGMIGYYCCFVQDFLLKAAPLFHLLKKDSVFSWSEEAQKFFNILHTCLMTAPILNYPNFQKPFIVQTDVSLFAIGAVLSQLDNENVEHPVAYCSRTLNPHKKNYTVTEKECLAVIYACKQFQVYIHGTRFL